MHHRPIRLGLAALAFSLSALAGASDHATPREARALFDQAVKYLQANGQEKAWAAFNNRKGPFVKKDLYVYVIDRQGTYVANGAAPGGVLEHPGTIKDPQRVRESWQSTFGGSGNANKIAVLEEGMKYTPIGISPEQAQFLETRKFQINEIARIFRVPPHMVGDLEKSSFSNIEQQSLEFVKYTLDPWVIRWEQSIQRSHLSRDEKAVYFVKFNLEGLLRGDYQSRMNGYAIGRQNGWMSANDIRELENLDRIPAEDGGDLYLINGNMLPLKNAGAFADTPTDDGKEEKTDEEILELEEPNGDELGDAGTDTGKNPVPERDHRRGKLV